MRVSVAGVWMDTCSNTSRSRGWMPALPWLCSSERRCRSDARRSGMPWRCCRSCAPTGTRSPPTRCAWAAKAQVWSTTAFRCGSAAAAPAAPPGSTSTTPIPTGGTAPAIRPALTTSVRCAERPTVPRPTPAGGSPKSEPGRFTWTSPLGRRYVVTTGGLTNDGRHTPGAEPWTNPFGGALLPELPTLPDAGRKRRRARRPIPTTPRKPRPTLRP